MTFQEMDKKIHSFTDMGHTLVDQFHKESGIQSSLANEIQTNKANIKKLEDKAMLQSKIIAVMSQAGQLARDNAKQHFEKIVTDALQFVTQSNEYRFVIQDKGGAKPAYDFYIESMVDGKPCLQKPEDANGGGFIDIISTTLKYAYLEIFDDPSIVNMAVLLDEPGKMISDQMSVKFAEYLKFLGKHFNRQTIMITHNSNLSSSADSVFQVDKGINGYSKVTDMSLIPQYAVQNVQDLLNRTGGIEDESEN